MGLMHLVHFETRHWIPCHLILPSPYTIHFHTIKFIRLMNSTRLWVNAREFSMRRYGNPFLNKFTPAEDTREK